MSNIRWFQEIGVNDIALVGGKGANLGEMAKAGLPVPPGFCLTATTYRDFIQATGLDARIHDILAATDLDDPEEVRTQAAVIRAAIIEQGMPEHIAKQLKESYDQLSQELGLEEAGGVPVAVRSSATAEDLPHASFAGQMETFLNVRSHDDLLERTKHCWASMWSGRAINYRTMQGFEHEKVYVAVVVQAMIPSEVAGIMFTANPVTSSRHEIVINASWGLGEAIVSGLVTPDTITVRKKDGRLVSYTTAPKARLIAYGADGGTVELDTPVAQRHAQVLSEAQIGELVDLGQRIETHYGAPQDIEWGLYEERFYILQSRAVTTLEPEKEIVTDEMEYNRSMFVEIFPDALSPSFLSVIGPIMHGMLEFTFEKLGFKPPKDMHGTGLFYNQIYLNHDYLVAAFDGLTPRMQEQMVTQIVSPFGRHKRRMRLDRSLAFYKMIARWLHFLFKFPRQLPDILTRYRSDVAAAADLQLETMSDAEILAHIDALMFGSVGRLINYDFLLIVCIQVTYQILGTLLVRYFGEETEAIRGKLISGVTGNVNMESNKALWDLAQKAKASPAVSDLLRKCRETDVRGQLEQTPAGRSFLEEMEVFLDSYGHRELRMDALYPTWGEDPTPVLSFVRAYLDADESQGPHRQQARLVKERQELTEEVKERMQQDWVGRYLIWPIFRRVLHHTQIHTRERDTLHFEMTRVIPHMRRLLLELGGRWHERGLFADQDDVFYLTWDELNQVARAPSPMHDVVAANRAEYEVNKHRPWPLIIRGDEEIYAEGAVAHDEGEGQRKGVAGSPGVVTGVARVIHGPEDFHTLQNNEILVAPLTNPVWTPLFAIAGAVVTEVGGILSHGAIVAREYGIPAVMGVPGATQLISQGQTLTVDGNKGIVLLEGVEAS